MVGQSLFVRQTLIVVSFTMVKAVPIVAIVIMCLALAYGFTSGDLAREGAVLTGMPWGVVTLIDFYIGILIFSTWVFFRESNPLVMVAWIIAFIFTGNLATAVYLLKALIQAKGDMQKLMFGVK